VPLAVVEAATLLSGTGNGVATVALPWLVLERTGSAAAAGVVAAATAVPALVSGLFSGTLVDLFGRRRVAVGSDVASAAAVAAIPLVDGPLGDEAGGLTVGWLVVLAALGAVFDPAGITAREAMLPAAAVRAGWRMERANGLHEAVWGVAFLLGPGAGGVLIGVVGAAATLWATAGGFALSAALLALVRLPGAGAPPAHEQRSGVWRSTLEGLGFVWHDRLLRTVALLSMALVGLYLPVEAVILPVHFQAAGAPERLGLLVLTMSAGGVLGALGYSGWGPRVRRRTTFVVSLAGTGALLVGLALLPPYAIMIALALGVGLLYGPVDPLVNYAMQTRTPERLRGRVIGVITSATYGAGPVGYLLAGPLVDQVGVRPAFLAMSLGLLAVALAAIALPSLRELDREPRHPPAAPQPEPGPIPLGKHTIR
jgi:MFS family permease